MSDPTWTNGIVDLYKGDCREVLAELPEQSIHCVVTSPPYWGLRDYGIEPNIWDGEDGCEHKWDIKQYTDKRGVEGTGLNGRDPYKGGETRVNYSEGFCLQCTAWLGTLGLEPTPELYVQHIVEVFREVKRVLRNDGTLWLNLGDSYAANRGSGSKSVGEKQATNNGSLLESLYVPTGLKPKDLVGIPWRIAFALQADGWYLRSDIIWNKPNPMPESVTDRPTKSHEYLFLLTKSAKYYYDADAIRESFSPYSEPSRLGGNGPTPYDIGSGKSNSKLGNGSRGDSEAGRNKRSVWTIATHPFPEAHFAIFPEKLVEPCILAGTPAWGVCPKCGAPYKRIVEKSTSGGHLGSDSMDGNTRNNYGGQKAWDSYISPITQGWRKTCNHSFPEPVPATVLDPFIGSGTTAIVAQRLGRRCIGIDASEDYLKNIAVKRISGIALPMQLDV